MIPLDCLAGSAMVIPYFSFHEKVKSKPIRKLDTPITGTPAASDVFWCVDRKFFDRSGWEELEVHDIGVGNNRNEINMNNIQSFIDNNSIQPAVPEEPEEEFREDFPEFLEDEEISNLFNNEKEDY